MCARPGRKRGSGKTKVEIERYLISSKEPEEVLFKLNEFLYGQAYQSSRKNLRIPINLDLLWKFGEQANSGHTYTLSREGMFIKTPKPVEKDSEIEISFSLPEQEGKFVVWGKVIHSISLEEARDKGLVSGMVVIFKELEPGLEHKLDKFITERARKVGVI